jgi:tetratricopeptide (TPR) repeat protein
MRSSFRGVIAEAVVLGVLAFPLLAQCPDGTPLPCERSGAALRRAPSERERRRSFLVLPFRNLSRTAARDWLVEASPTMLADALGQWTEVSVVPDEQLYPALRRQGLRPGEVADLARVRRMAAETGGWTAVTGEIVATAGHLRVSARAYDVVSQRLVARASGEVALTGDVRPAFDSIATILLRTAGLDAANADVGSATTRSFDAYRAYLQGLAYRNRSEYRHAREAFAEAVRMDSSFAQAYAKLAEVSLLALSVLEPSNPAYGYADRAAALAGRLPARAARQVRALHSLVNGEFTPARRELEALVAEDSNDVEALETLASLEFLDPLLEATPQHGERRRGSLNAAVHLLRRVLELDPARHGAYQGLVAVYLLAGGQAPGAVAGYRRDVARPVRSSVQAWCSCDFEIRGEKPPSGDAGPDVAYAPVVTDSLELVPLVAVREWPAESLAAARARARTAARTWAHRWLAAGPSEAEAHRAAARVAELDNDLEAALRELRVVDSLGAEAEAEAVSARRMILLGKLGRLSQATAIADSLWRARYFGGELFLEVPAMTEAYAWATNLFAAAGDFARARAALAAFSARLSLRMETAEAEAAAVAALAGTGVERVPVVVLPNAIRAAVRDSLRAELARAPGDPLLGTWLRALSRVGQ